MHKMIDYTGAAISGYAMLVLLVGWGMGVDPIVRGASDGVGMVPSTALCFIMLGSCMMTVRNQSAIEALVFSISLISMFVFFGFVLGHNVSQPDQNFVDVLNFEVRPVDGMAWGTVLGISLLATALAVLAFGDIASKSVAVLLMAVIGLNALGFVIAKFWDSDLVAVVRLYEQMSIPTLALLLLAVIGVASFATSNQPVSPD
ncbi:hypothetical protein BVC71_12180 [Marivivens niveibacter]|uniref:Uncharacterized protein n=1 Tax=Marivivens niveibacter TaxID=1930667 RepID=A0A251WWD3_9RHOB|nr:hypothetical protein [Marivivens niveibacter]OUD08682.1 hypothetical protein BVC71_12180 [Marivivens niveibacter]